MAREAKAGLPSCLPPAHVSALRVRHRSLNASFSFTKLIVQTMLKKMQTLITMLDEVLSLFSLCVTLL